MAEIVNPYIAGAPVTEARMFFGREDVFDWIKNNLSGRYADHILVVHGQRRVGKTSVLKQLGNHLPERYIPIFFDLQGRTHTSLDRFLWWLAREIVRVLKQERNIDLPLPEKESFTADLEYFESQFLLGLKETLGEHILLLTFDEFDNLEESEIKEELARPLIDYFRRLINNKSLNFIFSIGSSGRKLENMQASYTEFFKTALYKKISFLTRAQTHHLVTQPVEGILEYDPAAVEKIYETTFGHPYFTQLICHELFSLCQKTGQRRLGSQDVKSILDDVIERGTVNLKFTWDEATDLEKWILAALANSENSDQHSLAEFLKKQRVRFTNSDLTSSLLHLVEKDILTVDYHFVIQLMKHWLQKNRPLEQVREELTEVNPIANRYIEIGLEFKNSGVYDKALESFHEALVVDSDNIQAQVSIAQVYMDQRVYEKAVGEFEKALVIDDEDVVARSGLCEAHLAIGDASMKKGRTREAVQSYQRVLGINTEHTDARQRMAELSQQRAEKALKEGREEEALSFFTEAMKYTPEDPGLITRVNTVKAEKKARELQLLLARSEKEAGDKNWVAAIATLEEASRLSPDDTTIIDRLNSFKVAGRNAWLENVFTRAKQAIQTERWKDAVTAVQEVLAEEPENSIARELLAEINLKQKETRLKDISMRAVRTEESGHWDEAIEAWKEYLSIDPGDQAALSSLEKVTGHRHQEQLNMLRTRARALAKSEKYSESLAVWEEFLKLNPDELQTAQVEMEKVKQIQELARTYAEAQTAFTRKDYDRATKLFKEIVLVDEDFKDASRRMAESVKLRRSARRGWQSRWLWAGLGLVLLIVIVWVSYKPLSAMLSNRPAQTALNTPLPGGVNPATSTAPPTAGQSTPMLTATAALPIGSLYWTQLSDVSFAEKDDVTDIVVDGNLNGKIYVTTMNSGVYRSIDGGNSWQPFQNGLDYARFDDLAIDPDNPSILYTVTSDGKVYKTLDNGKSWNLVHKVLDYSYFPYQLAVAPWNSQVIFESGNGTIYRSDDAGETWHILNEQSCPWVLAFALHPSQAETLFAAGFSKPDSQFPCTGGIYKSTDGGTTWESIGMKGYYSIGEGGFVVGGVNGETMYVNGFDADGKTQAFRSRDGGHTWQPILDQGCFPFRMDPTDPAHIYCRSSGQLLVSNDAGTTWQTHPLMSASSFQSLALYRDGKNILMGGKGIYLSTDGGQTWTKRSSGLGAGRSELKVDPYNDHSLYLQEGICSSTSDHPLYRSRDGINWEFVEKKSCDIAFDADGKTLYRIDISSSDAGKKWTENTTKGLTGILASPKISGEIYSTTIFSSIQTSTDFGVTWSPVSLSSLPRYPRLFIDALGKVLYANAYFRSIDGGKTWTSCKANIETTIADQVIAIDPRDSNHVYAATSQKGDMDVMSSTDGCQSWKPLSGLGNKYVNSLAIDPNTPDWIYVATDTGGLFSYDSGGNGAPINEGLLGNLVVYSIAITPQSDVYAATPFGIFKLEQK